MHFSGIDISFSGVDISFSGVDISIYAVVTLCIISNHVSILQVFFGVVVFGLFHGLIFLPVLLSLVGPAPYLTEDEMKKDSDNTTHGQFDDIQNANRVC